MEVRHWYEFYFEMYCYLSLMHCYSYLVYVVITIFILFQQLANNKIKHEQILS